MYAYCQDLPGVSVDDHAKVDAELGDEARNAAGLVAHVAGPIEGGIRIIDVWESKEDAERFQHEHLEPAARRAHGETTPEMVAKFRILEVTGVPSPVNA